MDRQGGGEAEQAMQLHIMYSIAYKLHPFQKVRDPRLSIPISSSPLFDKIARPVESLANEHF